MLFGLFLLIFVTGLVGILFQIVFYPGWDIISVLMKIYSLVLMIVGIPAGTILLLSIFMHLVDGVMRIGMPQDWQLFGGGVATLALGAIACLGGGLALLGLAENWINSNRQR